MQYAPTRIRAKFGGFHISAHGYTKNAPDFTHPNKDIPKSYPVLGANLRRRTFRGVCFCAPTRIHEKPARFHISAPGYTKNAPDFTLPNRDTPKTRSILDPNPWRRTFRGVCFCAPTRVHAKFGGFHISAHECAKNAPDFTFPNKDMPKTRPVLGANPRRGVFRGVCNTPLHGYVQNLTGFIFPHPDTPKTRPVLDPNLRRGSFRGVCFCAPTRVHQKPGGFLTLPHDIARNPAGFGLCHTT